MVVMEKYIDLPKRSRVGSLHLSRDLILAEICGSWRGSLCYLMARSVATRIEETIGPLSQMPISDPSEFGRNS